VLSPEGRAACSCQISPLYDLHPAGSPNAMIGWNNSPNAIPFGTHILGTRLVRTRLIGTLCYIVCKCSFITGPLEDRQMQHHPIQAHSQPRLHRTQYIVLLLKVCRKMMLPTGPLSSHKQRWVSPLDCVTCSAKRCGHAEFDSEYQKKACAIPFGDDPLRHPDVFLYYGSWH
jgi:hypothetical protein